MTMHLNLFFDRLSNGKLLTFKTGPPCIVYSIKSTYDEIQIRPK